MLINIIIELMTLKANKKPFLLGKILPIFLVESFNNPNYCEPDDNFYFEKMYICCFGGYFVCICAILNHKFIWSFRM